MKSLFSLGLPENSTPKKKIDGRTNEDQEQKTNIPPSVEAITCKEQKGILYPEILPEYRPIKRKYKDYKDKIGGRIEKHLRNEWVLTNVKFSIYRLFFWPEIF
jgi:hypothetical protein